MKIATTDQEHEARVQSQNTGEQSIGKPKRVITRPSYLNDYIWWGWYEGKLTWLRKGESTIAELLVDGTTEDNMITIELANDLENISLA